MIDIPSFETPPEELEAIVSKMTPEQREAAGFVEITQALVPTVPGIVAVADDFRASQHHRLPQLPIADRRSPPAFYDFEPTQEAWTILDMIDGLIAGSAGQVFDIGVYSDIVTRCNLVRGADYVEYGMHVLVEDVPVERLMIRNANLLYTRLLEPRPQLRLLDAATLLIWSCIGVHLAAHPPSQLAPRNCCTGISTDRALAAGVRRHMDVLARYGDHRKAGFRELAARFVAVAKGSST